MHWQHKNAVVCGASSGLGLELARQLAGQCKRVLLVARDTERLDQVQGELQEQFLNCEVSSVAADLSQTTSAARLAASIRSAEFGTVDLLVNAIGQSDRGTIMRLTPERLRALFEINVQAVLLPSQQVYPFLRRPGGTIVNIGSLASRFAPRYLGGYSAAKHALAAVTQQMRLELAPDGIHVMFVCPGPIRRSHDSTRYEDSPSAVELPAEALKAGGGAKLSGLDPGKLADQILRAAARRRAELVRPRRARLLMFLSAVSPKLGDYVLQKMSS